MKFYISSFDEIILVRKGGFFVLPYEGDLSLRVSDVEEVDEIFYRIKVGRVDFLRWPSFDTLLVPRESGIVQRMWSILDLDAKMVVTRFTAGCSEWGGDSVFLSSRLGLRVRGMDVLRVWYGGMWVSLMDFGGSGIRIEECENPLGFRLIGV